MNDTYNFEHGRRLRRDKDPFSGLPILVTGGKGYRGHYKGYYGTIKDSNPLTQTVRVEFTAAQKLETFHTSHISFWYVIFYSKGHFG